MNNYLGIFFALIALFAWGVGDFLIQRTTRVVGVWKALFYIGILGFFVLLPFVVDDLRHLERPDFLLLGLATFVAVFASLFDFAALQQGKMAIVEPLFGIEIPIIIGLGITFGGERLTLLQLIFIAVIFIGVMFAITIHHSHLYYHRRLFEKGVILGGIAAVGTGLFTFLVGLASREIAPLVTIWFVHSLVAVVCALYLGLMGQLGTLVSDFRRHARSIIGQSVFDNVAWIAFALSSAHIPTSISAAISEGYIALAVLLGIFINKEKIQPHQLFGAVLAIIGVIVLSAITPE